MGDIFYVSSPCLILCLGSLVPVVYQATPLPDETVATYLPVVTVTGRPSRITQEQLSSKINTGQWIGFGKEKALFPFTSTVPKDSQWTESNRPFPNQGNPRYLSVTEYLNAILPSESEGASKCFIVEIQSFHFLGPAPAPARVCLIPLSLSHIPDFLFHSPWCPNTQREMEGSVGLHRNSI